MFSEAGIILLSRVPLARVGSKLRDEFLQELHLRIFGEGLEVFSLLLSLIIPTDCSIVRLLQPLCSSLQSFLDANNFLL